jgi:hypothetical protein
MAVQTSALNLGTPLVVSGNWRSRTLTIILVVAIAAVFWVDSRYPALMKRYHAGTQVKAVGALTFGAVYPVDSSMPYLTRVWRTTINWLDANRVGMTFSFLFGPAALAFLSTRRRRRTKSRYLNTLIGAAAGVPLGSAAIASLRLPEDFTLPGWAWNPCWPLCSPRPPSTWLCWL